MTKKKLCIIICLMKKKKNSVLVAAATPGRNLLTPRFQRHLCILNIEKTSEQSINLIFGSILKGFLKHH